MKERTWTSGLAAGALVVVLALATGSQRTACVPVPVEPTCVGAGGTVHPWDETGPPCCVGLAPGAMTEVDPETGACVDLDGAAVCIACGDGVCGDGESACNCPDDCAAADCVAEGEATFPWDPNDPGCCPGLTRVGAAEYDPASGRCELLVGGALCAACGDGECGVAETPCTCAEDCAEPTACVRDADCPAGTVCLAPGDDCCSGAMCDPSWPMCGTCGVRP